jgi:hypothetical protein
VSAGFAAAVCEGFYGSLAELLSLNLTAKARTVLLDLRERTGIAIAALTVESTEVTQEEERRSTI